MEGLLDIVLILLDKRGSTAQFTKLIRALAEVGLTAEVRNGEDNSLLIFLKVASEDVLANVVNRSRLKDWLHGIRQVQPVGNAMEALTSEPLTASERLRQVHSMINHPKADGGAGITPKSGDWKNVESIFPLHDHAMNKKWMSEFPRKTFLTQEDLDEVKNVMGEKVYFPVSWLISLILSRLATIMPSCSHTSSL